MKLIWVSGVATTLAFALHVPAQAQQAWEIESPGRNQISASTVFDTGHAIALRCSGRQAEIVVTGLPPASPPANWTSPIYSRTIEVFVDGRRLASSMWLTPEDPTAAFYGNPGAFARAIRTGKSLTLRVVPPEGPATRIVLDLPEGREGLETIFADCGIAAIDPRDEALDLAESARRGLPPAYEWRGRPQATYPSAAQNANVKFGLAVVSCIAAPSGRLSECRADYSAPAGYGFDEAAVFAVRRARLKPLEGSEPQPISFTMKFLLQ